MGCSFVSVNCQLIRIDLFILFAVIPHWTGHVAKLDKKGDAGSPLLLFISSAATRVVELNRSVINFNLLN